MLALIDGDLVAYRCAASCKEEDSVDIAIFRADKLMHQILHEVNADEYKLYISGQDNFRYNINPEYKANRREQERPKYLEDAREFLVAEWKARVVNGWETDDQLGIEQHYDFNNDMVREYPTIICSLDKDLRMIPGHHYSWEISGTVNGNTWTKPAESVFVTEKEGTITFFRQMLIGDVSDNIIGVAGIGKKKADKFITNEMSEQEMFDFVYDKYNDPQRFAMNAACLWIMREVGKTWHDHLNLTLPSELEPEVAQTSKFMKSLKEDI